MRFILLLLAPMSCNLSASVFVSPVLVMVRTVARLIDSETKGMGGPGPQA